MAKARKAVLVCRPCGAAVTVSDLGTAVVECWECGLELEPAKIVSAKTLVAVPKAALKKAAAKKPPAKKAAAAKKKLKK